MPDARFPRPVICKWCGNKYRSIIPDNICKGVQGDGCASSVINREGSWYVVGGYGSGGYDMHRLKFVANAPSEEVDPICDNCIGERQISRDLVEICDCNLLKVSDESEVDLKDRCASSWNGERCESVRHVFTWTPERWP